MANHPSIRTTLRALHRWFPRRLSHGNQPEIAVAPIEKRCYHYGLYYLEFAGPVPFRWTRRFFGFYVNESGLRAVRLHFYVSLRTTLTGQVNGVEVLRRAFGKGEHTIVLPVERVGTETTGYHLGFASSEHWTPPNSTDRRKLGIQLRALTALTDTGLIGYPPANWVHNTTKADSLLYDAFVAGPVKGEVTRGVRNANAELNREEREATLPVVASTPLKLYVEVALQCNLRCPSCFHAYIDPKQHKELINFMSPFLFERVASTLFPGALMVWYNGNGESLLHPNISSILRTALDGQFIPALLTSGSRFTEENMRILVEGGFCLSISVDSPYADDFERLRKGANFSRLVAAIAFMQELKRQLKQERFSLTIQCVAQQSNVHQLCDLVSWSAACGAEAVQFLPLHTFGMSNTYLEKARLDHSPRQANEEMLKAIRLGSDLGIKIWPFPPMVPDALFMDEWWAAVEENHRLPSAADGYLQEQAKHLAQHPANVPTRRCLMAWAECFIGVDGAVAPCDMDLERTTVGNLYDDEFVTIWNGSAMREMRSSVNRRPVGPCCFGTCMFRREIEQPFLAAAATGRLP